MTGAPALRILSLGAGVQSTTVLLWSAEGALPALDAAIFADTGWEPTAVYEHLDRLEEQVARPAGIPIHRVRRGHIRDDALDPNARYAQMPLYVRGPDGGRGMLRRQCTAEYKLAPIKAEVRRLLGYQHPTPVPAGVFVEQWVRHLFRRIMAGGTRFCGCGVSAELVSAAFPTRWYRQGEARLDQTGLQTFSAITRIRVHAAQRLYRLPVPQQRLLARHA